MYQEKINKTLIYQSIHQEQRGSFLPRSVSRGIAGQPVFRVKAHICPLRSWSSGCATRSNTIFW